MLEVIVVYTDGDVETYSIITYLKGERYWQLLSTDGNTISIPDHAIKKIEVHQIGATQEA
jgi:acid phosphatase class B